MSVGFRISHSGCLGTIRYVGEVEGTTGCWLGVEWDDPGRGKHNGEHNGKVYFQCRKAVLWGRSRVLLIIHFQVSGGWLIRWSDDVDFIWRVIPPCLRR